MKKTSHFSVSFLNPETGQHGGINELRIRFSAGGYERLIHFESTSAKLIASGDALLCLGLVPAMELGLDLEINAHVDEDLLANADQIQSLLCSWYPGYRPISIRAGVTKRKYPERRGTGLFYSGGVDSSYSLASAHDRLTGLVTIIGADVDPLDTRRVERLEAIASNVAGQFGLKQIFVRTDIRKVSDRMIGWVEYHGAVLAAVRHMLANEFENQLIASSADEASWPRRWGSHPGLDRLWGTAGARIEHHGLEHRLAKIERISREPILMQQLRVCNRSFDHCGVCHSCQFMLAALDILGIRDKAPTYSHLKMGRYRLRVTGEGSLSDLTKMRLAAIAGGRQEELVNAIDDALRRYSTKKRFQHFVPVDEIARRYKRLKRQIRFRRQMNQSIE